MPITYALGWQQIGLLLWSALVFVALVAWVRWFGRIVPRYRNLDELTAAVPGGTGLARSTRRGRFITAALSLAFVGQGFSFYAVTAWLPAFLASDAGTSTAAAGVIAGLFQAFGIVGALALRPLARALSWSSLALMVLVTSAWIMLPIGLLAAPHLAGVWVAFAGFAQGGTFTVISIVTIEKSHSAAESRRTSAIVPTVGYRIAATGPVVIGAVQQNAASWDPYITVLGASTLLTALAGITAAVLVRLRRPESA